jgi:hypothetical protein
MKKVEILNFDLLFHFDTGFKMFSGDSVSLPWRNPEREK